ncbi:bifunctional diaminohydroxyphosphoribosylaminopyrimidine deaminase/5-amino-6-(5-phosphoribosylamino)uracil reductase RibD [Thermicanus aegyptius]|uniref:bifunctional diaminohydroxyphosphoribosylaminopyrimidine deaminase/5-amino-6-(5-phosphoribosylamino)uracil reductase RibD n=1 Tax=Thermicanus aegyptius TaxID=94009 RepID=UPI00048BA5E9|nr:bifunctional diaminohydroxyphosphoribosylaminopyrimidine deaminase/5-amino-6-(5-phosphoribosylamino)uracil reductase RibD [Thermicanus aegyptius]
MNDEFYMNHAFALAASTEGRTWPNPMVGAVIVKEGRIVGFGAHLKAGTPHAEVHALKMAGEEAEGGTLYVTLEPCSHYGRTPPCADQIIAAGLKRVVVATLDPNPLVSGKGVEKMRKAGIHVEVGLGEEKGKRLNEVFFHYITKRRPFTVVKMAMTLDGKIAAHTGDSRWVSGAAAREYVHRLRNQADAVMVGIGTVLADDPLLTTRLPEGGKNPLRIVVDTRLRIPLTARVLDTSAAPTLIACGEGADAAKMAQLREKGAEVLPLPEREGRVDLKELLRVLGLREIAFLLVEGGAEMNGSLLMEGLVDKVLLFLSPKLIGGKGPTPFGGKGFPRMDEALPLTEVQVEKVGEDWFIQGYLRRGG